MSIDYYEYKNRDISKANFRNELYHGINSYMEVIFHDRDGLKTVGVGFVQSVRIFINYMTNTETEIGYYGEPLYIIPRSANYTASIRKYVSDSTKTSSGRSELNYDGVAGHFTNAIMNFKDGSEKANGLILTFDVNIYTKSGGNLLTNKLRNCVLTDMDRRLNSDGFMVDEFKLSFTKFKQQLHVIN